MNKENLAGPALAVLTGLLLAACYAPLSLGWAAWLALTPLFCAVIAAPSPRAAAALGGLAGLVFYSLALSWMPAVVNFPALFFWAVFAFWVALHAALLRGLWGLAETGGLNARRALAWAAAAGLCWAGLEYFRSEIWWLECPWLGLGYSQTFISQLFQTLSVWGVYGLSAFIVAVNAALALALRGRSYLPAALALAATAAAWAWGEHRLKTFPADAGRPFTAALVQAERSDINKLARLSLSPEAAGADLLVWPECSVYPPRPDETAYEAYISAKLAPSKAEAVVGVCVPADRRRGVRRANYTLHLGRDKERTGKYEKMHPVQFVEWGLPRNRRPEPVRTPLGLLGPQICYDLAFENGSRLMAEAGAEILITPTLDPMEWTALQHTQHSDMTAARAVETGLWIIRAASSGRSQVVDSLGRERATLANGAEGALVAQARLAAGGTFYTRYGWLLAPFALLFTLGAGLALWRRK
ncbi:MAG: apolipoprotein N-acyltransferase [Elusimicrobiales bacterium]